MLMGISFHSVEIFRSEERRVGKECQGVRVREGERETKKERKREKWRDMNLTHIIFQLVKTSVP